MILDAISVCINFKSNSSLSSLLPNDDLNKEYQIQCGGETVVLFFTNISTPQKHRWQPKYLPLFWPGFNPIETIWLTIKARWFNNDVCKNEEQLQERLKPAILDVVNNPKKDSKNCRYRNVMMTTAVINRMHSLDLPGLKKGCNAYHFVYIQLYI
ncbi:MAG: hypothetical protein PVI00_06835 [Desulfobacterales bacterium]|jgi:hypothetical protein